MGRRRPYVKVETPANGIRYVLLGAPFRQRVHFVERLKRHKPCLLGECPKAWHQHAVELRGYAPAFKTERKVETCTIVNPAAGEMRNRLLAAGTPMIEAARQAKERHGWLSRDEKRETVIVHLVLLNWSEPLCDDVSDDLGDRDYRGLVMRFERPRGDRAWKVAMDAEPQAGPLPPCFEVEPVLCRLWNVALPDRGEREGILRFPGSETA